MTTAEHLQNIIKTLPNNPGCYQYFNDKGEIIYVGKAKNLRNRVSSYFKAEDTLSSKTAVLVKKIVDIKTIVVDTEWEALLLENSLIKKHQPKYNILLKDGKTYPWICIKNEPFPRVILTRNKPIADKSLYFGPYSSVKMAYTLIELIKQLFKVRTCNNSLTQLNIQKKRFKLCLQYHIGNCKGVCCGLEAEEEYEQTISMIKNLLEGNLNVITKDLKEQMRTFASNLEFEKAHEIKVKLALLDEYQSKSTVVNSKDMDIDVVTIVSDEKFGYLNFMKISSGAIVHSHTIEVHKKLNESDEELITTFINDLRESRISTSKEIITSNKPSFDIPSVSISEPKIGDKRQLIELSIKNAQHYKDEMDKRRMLVDPERHTNRILEQMKKDLHLHDLPRVIECFDNSNILGQHAVAAMVQFKDARPNKAEYRHYNIKTVIGANDYASMEEIVFRRYSRLIEEQKPLPDLIIVDGGKGQITSAVTSLAKIGLYGKIPLIGIAEKLEEIYFPNDSIPLYLDKKSETLHVIQHIRDEAHRFGITHHRKKRSKETIKTELSDIKGIGLNTAELLLKEFKSVKRIKQTNIKDIEKIVGKSKAKLIQDWINS